MHHCLTHSPLSWLLCCRPGRYVPVARSTTKEPLRRSAASHSRTPSGAFGAASVGPVGKGKDTLHRGRLRRGAVSLCAGLKCRACKAVLVGRHLQAAQFSASVQLNTAGCSCELAWVMQAALALEQTVHSRQKVARYCLQDHLSLKHNIKVSVCMLETADLRGIWQQKAQTLCCSNSHSQCGAELSVRVLSL